MPRFEPAHLHLPHQWHRGSTPRRSGIPAAALIHVFGEHVGPGDWLYHQPALHAPPCPRAGAMASTGHSFWNALRSIPSMEDTLGVTLAFCHQFRASQLPAANCQPNTLHIHIGRFHSMTQIKILQFFLEKNLAVFLGQLKSCSCCRGVCVHPLSRQDTWNLI